MRSQAVKGSFHPVVGTEVIFVIVPPNDEEIRRILKDADRMVLLGLILQAIEPEERPISARVMINFNLRREVSLEEDQDILRSCL